MCPTPGYGAVWYEPRIYKLVRAMYIKWRDYLVIIFQSLESEFNWLQKLQLLILAHIFGTHSTVSRSITLGSSKEGKLP